MSAADDEARARPEQTTRSKDADAPGAVPPPPTDERDRRDGRDRSPRDRSPPRRDGPRDRSPRRRDDSRDRRDRRDRSRDRRDRDRGHHPYRRDRDRDRGDRATSAEREAERKRRREERELEKQRRELEALERDTRTVFAYNLSTKADEREIFQFFSKVGVVNDVRIIYDRNTPTSKGMAYVEFADVASVPGALAATGQILRNQVVMVKASEAEKNAAWAQAKKEKLAAASVGYAASQDPLAGSIPLPAPLPSADAVGGPCDLLVHNLHADIGDADLKAVFEPFGETVRAEVDRDESGASRGSGRVRYARTKDAVTAIAQLNGLELVKQPLRVSMAPPPTSRQPEEREIGDDATGIRMDARSRAALMARLAGRDPGAVAEPVGIDPATGLPVSAEAMAAARVAREEAAAAAAAEARDLARGVLGPGSPIPTQCLLLKNMFRPEEETEPEWWVDIAEDVREECGKHGEVSHVFVDRESEGFVYLKFATTEGAEGAKRALHGRWFAGRTVGAEFQFTQVYDRHFDL